MRKITEILLIEDNEGDILLTIEALRESKNKKKISTIRDGRKAVDFFETLKADQPAPDIILLDINLPKLSGHEVLNYLKANEKFKTIPVIILTTSSAVKDIQKAYSNHANCFITKPIDLEDFIKIMAKVEEFWLNVVALPAK